MVYRAIERSTSMPVALKLLMNSEEFANPLDITALMRDFAKLRKVTGPHVAQMLDAVDDPEGAVLVYQFLEGENFGAIPSKRRIPQREAVDLAAQLMAALGCGEKAGVPHGEIKPSNVVLGYNEGGRSFALVLDWGLAPYRKGPAQDSLPFLDPERLSGSGASPRGDLFSTAAVLHYLLRGSPLVAGASAAEVAGAWQSVRPGSLKVERPDLDPRFVDWLSWLMELRSKKRPRDSIEARRGLAAFKPPSPPMAPRYLSLVSSLTPALAPGLDRHATPPVAPRAVCAALEADAVQIPCDDEIRESLVEWEEPAPTAAARPSRSKCSLFQSAAPVFILVILLAAVAGWGAHRLLREKTVSPMAAEAPLAASPSAATPAPSIASASADEKRYGTLIAEISPEAKPPAPEALRSSATAPASPPPAPVPVGESKHLTDRDIGNPGKPGSSAYRSDARIWTIRGGGTDIWLKSDQFHFTSQEARGSDVLEVRVLGVERTDPWAKAGLMFRAGIEPGAAHIALVATPLNGLSFQWRDKAGDDCQYRQVPGVSMPVWLRLERAGNVFKASFSKDNKEWIAIDQPHPMDFPETCQAGYCVTAHNEAAVTTALLEE